MLIDLHMNSAENENASGTEVIYSAAAPHRRDVAAKISKAVAATLGTIDRGPKSDKESARGSLAILNRTACPAYLIEMGFVSNSDDVRKVRECGMDAVIEAIRVIEEEHRR